jgi:hypothetical protein
MTEIPKLVHRRLRVAASSNGSDGSHPDADALSAFAEQALSMTDRENVLAHLALCATCRDVVLTALPEIVVPEPVVAEATETIPAFVGKTGQRKTILWPSLRWGMLAAGVVTAILLARPGLEHLTSSARNRATSDVQHPAVADLRSQVAVGQGDVDASKTEMKSNALASDELTEAPANTSLSPQRRAAAAAEGRAISGKKKVNELSPLIADNRSSSADRPFPSGSEGAAIVRAKPALGTQAQAQTALSPDQSSPGQSFTQDETLGSSSGVLKESPQWEVEAGSLKRSLDSGLSWQTVLQPTNSLLCYASRGPEMWVGGQNGTLLRSTDGGASWTGITVSVGGKVLRSDIKNISMQAPAVVALTTTDGEQVASKDSGRTWEQK